MTFFPHGTGSRDSALHTAPWWKWFSSLPTTSRVPLGARAAAAQGNQGFLPTKKKLRSNSMALKHTLKRIPWDLSPSGQANPSSHRSPTVKVHLWGCALPTPLLHSPFASMPPQRNLHPCSCCGRSGLRQPFLQQTSSQISTTGAERKSTGAG